MAMWWDRIPWDYQPYLFDPTLSFLTDSQHALRLGETDSQDGKLVGDLYDLTWEHSENGISQFMYKSIDFSLKSYYVFFIS